MKYVGGVCCNRDKRRVSLNNDGITADYLCGCGAKWRFNVYGGATPIPASTEERDAALKITAEIEAERQREWEEQQSLIRLKQRDNERKKERARHSKEQRAALGTTPIKRPPLDTKFPPPLKKHSPSFASRNEWPPACIVHCPWDERLTGFMFREQIS